MTVRVVVSRCAKAAASRVITTANNTATLSARRLISAQVQPPTSVLQMRACSSSRFLSLADDDKKPRRGDGDDGDDEDNEGIEAAEGDATAEGETDASESGDKDGDLELEELEMYRFCVTETEHVDDEIMEMHMSNPLKWTPVRLARKFGMSKQRVEATIFLQAETAGLSRQELQAKIEEAQATAAQHDKDETAKLQSAEARGDEKEIKRLQKRERQEKRDVDEVDDEVLTAEEEAFVLGIDEDRYRNPDFFFLSDEFDGLPPLTRRLGKHKATDKLYPEEALEIQRLAAKKDKVVEHKSFAKPTTKASRWKFAVKDTTKIKLPLYMRGEDGVLRLATKDEVLPRSWVRRPAFFAGLNPSDN